MSPIELYDTTLRDGAQTEGISYSVQDKLRIVEKQDLLCRSQSSRRAGCAGYSSDVWVHPPSMSRLTRFHDTGVIAFTCWLALGRLVLAAEPTLPFAAIPHHGVEVPVAATAQVKWTYQGPQEGPIATLLFTVEGQPVSLDRFAPYRRAGGFYANDEIVLRTVTITEQAMERFLGALINTQVEEATSAGESFVSCTIIWTASDGKHGIEALLSPLGAQHLFMAARQPLDADPTELTVAQGKINPEAMRTLQSWGCALGLLPDIPAGDVTAQVHVAPSGLRWNAATTRFECTATLTNDSKAPIAAPISLVVDARYQVVLANAHGTTCETTPVGRGFLNVPVPGGAWLPGQRLETALEFAGPEEDPIEFSTKVLAGPGER